MKECVLYKPYKDKVRCFACANKCIISKGNVGLCGVRKNIKNKLYLLVYGKPIAVHIDPIEKKPLYHFMPNTKTFSFGTVGCNFRCKFCFLPDQNLVVNNQIISFRDLFRDSKVITSNGITKIGLPSKQHTITALGNIGKIKTIFKRKYSGDICYILPHYLPEVKCTANHQILIYNNGKIEPKSAKNLTKKDYLLLPKQKANTTEVIINTQKILEKNVVFIKKSLKITIKQIKEMALLKKSGIFSREIGKKFGLHPVYVRKLLCKIKKNGITNDLFYYENTPIVKGGLVKFKGEKGKGIPQKIQVSKQLAELLGYYCAEGHIIQSKTRPASLNTVFSYGKHEIKLITRTNKLIKSIFKINPKTIVRRTTTTVEIQKSSVGILLKDLCGYNSKNKNVPSIIAEAKEEVILSFLRAVIAGDGCILKECISINTVSKTFAMGLQNLLLHIGVLSSFYEWHPPKKKIIENRLVNQSTLYYIKIYPIMFRKKILEAGSQIQTQRGRTKFIETDKFWLVPLHKIKTKKYSGIVYNCEVIPDNNYLINFLGVSNCQNYDISQEKTIMGQKYTPKKIVELALENNCKSISYTYNEPTIFIEFVKDVAELAQKKGLKNIMVTNGYFTKESLDFIAPYIDAMNIDLKSFSNEFYLKHSGAKLKPVLDSIKRAHKKGIHIELTTLLIPGENDSKNELEGITKFIASIDKNIPWHISRFFPMYKMQDKSPTEIKTLKEAEKIGKRYLNYVHLGNV